MKVNQTALRIALHDLWAQSLEGSGFAAVPIGLMNGNQIQLHIVPAKFARDMRQDQLCLRDLYFEMLRPSYRNVSLSLPEIIPVKNIPHPKLPAKGDFIHAAYRVYVVTEVIQLNQIFHSVTVAAACIQFSKQEKTPKPLTDSFSLKEHLIYMGRSCHGVHWRRKGATKAAKLLVASLLTPFYLSTVSPAPKP